MKTESLRPVSLDAPEHAGLSTGALARLGGAVCVGSLLLLLAALSGCNSTNARRPASFVTGEPAAMARPNYPFSEIEVVYDAVLEGMTAHYFAPFPEIDKVHTGALQAFIRAEYPRDRFVREMVRDEDRPVLERGRDEPAFRQEKRFQDTFTVVVSVSVSMAKMIIGGKREIYVAKYVEKDPIRTELFGMVRSADDDEFVAWVLSEFTADVTALKLGSEHPVQPGDRVFEFSSPAETWQDLCGRGGYIIVRNGKIADIAITVMN